MTTFPDVYFLPEWGKFFETKEEKGESVIFELKNETGHVFYQFILREIPIKNGKSKYYDIITPYGFSGPVILNCLPGQKEELVKSFNEEFQRYCEKNHIITEYVRFNPWIRNINDFIDLYQLRNNGHTIFIDLSVADFFMEEFSAKARTQVRKAKKKNIEIEFDYNGSSTKEFHRLYEIMANKNKVENEYYLFSEDFLRNSFNELGGKQFFINAIYEGKYISSSLVVHHGEYMHYHLTANDPEYYHLAANSLIVYEACCWGIENGKKEIHLGGGNNEVLKFKKGFTRTQPLDLLMGKKIRNRKIYEELVALKKSADDYLNTDFFPLYRG